MQAAREEAPRGREYWRRLQAALSAAARRLADPSDPLHQAAMQALPGYTGYSPGMIAAALGMPDLWDLRDMIPALRYHPDKVCGVRWQRLPGLPGRVRFFPSNPFDRLAGWLPVAWEMPLYRSDVRPRTVVGYGAGNIPGSALMTAFLALAVTLRGEAPLPRPVPPPAVLVSNSRGEPILTPLVLSAIEEIDPGLVSMVAATVWDHDDRRLQERLVGAARIHSPERTMSFTVIGREMLEPMSLPGAGAGSLAGGTETMDVVALLAGLDSIFWDQSSGLSARIHFVEQDGPADHLPAEYARRLTARLRQIAKVIPRGAWPVRQLRDPFDRYRALEGSDRWGTGLQVMSEYDDPFVVIFDGRTGSESRPDPSVFAALVDECQTRVVVVRPVADIMDVPWRYLRLLPGRSLQSVSVAVGTPGEGLTRSFLDFATACGERGVTAIRVVGRGAFPRPAYSWDGFLPLDLVGRRPPGYFTTIEFDAPFEEMMQTYHARLTQLAALSEAQGGSRRR